jgi:hypothetical protein
MPIQFITPSIISSVANTQVTGTITASQIASVNASTVTSGSIPLAQGGTGLTSAGTSGNVLTSNGTTWDSAAPAALGVGQTWTNVTASRAMGTTYTNSTGKPITVLITFSGSGPGARHDIYVNGVNIAQCYATDYFSGVAATTHYQVGTFVIPNGATYSDNIGNASPSILLWFELR